ncbi:MAG: DUF2807 domain-containing protein [Bacteroidota bacterium]
MKNVLILILTCAFLLSCKKEQDRKCLKSTGSDGEKEIVLPSFNRLFLKEQLAYVLVQDTVEKIVIKGGENLLNFVDAKVSNGLLFIENKNKCNFLRTYKKVLTVEIHFVNLINIHYEGSETLTNTGKLNLTWFTLAIEDGGGPVDLNFDAYSVFTIINNGWGDFTYRGTVDYARFEVRSNGYCNTYGLEVKDSISVISYTPAPLKINADGAKLKAEISWKGDIYYKGITDGSPILYDYNEGELIYVP